MHDESAQKRAQVRHAVVIAGGGPTGLVLAAELALAKIDVAIVERRETQDLEGSRAGGLLARTIELFDQRGVAERFLANGKTMQVTTFAQLPLDISDFPTRHPYGLAIWQRRIEQILAEWVAELGVPIYRGCEVSGFVEDGEGIDVEVGGRKWLRAEYLVGCDGGRSAVRKAAGIDFPGWDASTSFLIAEAEMTGEPPVGIRRDEHGVYAMGKLEDGRVRVVLREERVAHGEPVLDELRAAIVALYGDDFGLTRASWLSRFSDATRQAASYRKGRVLLAGDAAHVHSPVGGQGLNLGVHDAVNLGWKLAQVIRKTSPSSLLDSYHSERHPIAARALRATMAGSLLNKGDARTEALRDTMTELMTMAQPRKHWAAIMSGLEIRYDLDEGHPLLGRRMPDLDLVVAGEARRVFSLLREAKPLLLNLGARRSLDIAPWSDRVRSIAGKYDGVWELPAVGVVPAPTAVLVRPDGYVAWVDDGDDDRLRAALTTWFGTPSTS